MSEIVWDSCFPDASRIRMFTIPEDCWIRCDCDAKGCECKHAPSLDPKKLREHGLPVPTGQVMAVDRDNKTYVIEGFTAS